METLTQSTSEMTSINTSDKLLASGFALHHEDRFTSVYINSEQNSIACVLKEEYIPIEFFKKAFTSVGEIVKAGKFKRFIFDKRALTTFHQPTMEWYFIHWKQEMLTYGLIEHRKLLPQLDWFVKAVMIAKADLMQRYPMNTIEQLDIQYCSTLEEAMAQ